jgi:hypothetical protein
MVMCAYCGSKILLGGKRLNELRFCNDECSNNGQALTSALVPQISGADVRLLATRIHSGPCPKCSGHGPVDVRVSHQVWSFLLITQWRNVQQVCCRRCAAKSQLGSLCFSVVLGWWGIPWGILMTPVQVGRNLLGLIRPPDPSRPSERLMNLSRLMITERMLLDRQTVSAD